MPLAKLACRVMLGERIADLGLPEEPMRADHVSVKEAVLPFDRFEGSDAILGPEMRSTGEVMGIARDFPTAFAKAQAAAGAALPASGTAFITVTDSDKAAAVGIAQILHDLGFRIVATRGTNEAIERMGIPATELKKVGEGSPHVVDWIENGDVDLVVNTPTGSGARSDGWEIRRAAVARGIPCLTTLSGGLAAARAIAAGRQGGAGGALAAGDPRRPRAGRGARSDRAEAADARALRPAHAADRRAPRRRAPTSCSSPRIPAARARAPGQFYMLAAERRWGGGADERPFLPRALQRPARARRAPGVHARGRRARAPSACASWAPGDGLHVTGPLGIGFPARRDGRRALLCGGGVGTAPLAIWQDELLARGEPAPALLGFRDGDHAPGATLLRNARVATDDGSHGHHGLVTDLLAARARRDAARRRLRLRPAADARGGPRAVRGARRALPARARVGRWRAASAPASAASCRCAPAATCACASTGRSLDGAAARGGAGALTASTSAACAWRTRSSTARAPSTRSPRGARSATRCSSTFPFAAFVSKTITLAPRDGNPPPRLWETPAGLINSIGLPNKGLRGYLERRPARARRGCPCRSSPTSWARRPRSCARSSRRSTRATEVDALELNVSCPNVATGLDIGADPAELAAVARARCARGRRSR